MPAASILIRLSAQAGDTNLSLAGMEADCRALAATHGYDVSAVHIDDGVSGSVRDRPGFLAWLAEGRSGTVEALISYSGDRLTREGVNAAALVLDVIEGKDSTTGAIVRKPIRFLSADDGLDSSGDSTAFRFNFVIKAEIARGERERIVARNIANQRRLRGEVGRFRGGEPPYGYEKAKRAEGGWTLVLHAEESEIVREIAARVLSGESLYAVVKNLKERKVPTRRGGPWRVPTLQSILTGDHVSGYTRHKGQAIRGEDGRPVRWFEPVLTDETLEQLRTIVRPPSAKRHGSDVNGAPIPVTARRKPKVTRLLSNLVRSACCDGPMYAVAPSPSKKHPIYKQVLQGKTCGIQVGINAVPLEEHVEAEFLRLFGRFEELRAVREADDRLDLATLDRSLQALGRAIAEPGADHALIGSQIAALHVQRVEVASRPASDRVRFEPTGRTVAESWQAGSLQARNTMLGDYLEGPITVAPVGHVRAVKTLDVARVSIPWRGSDPEREDYLAGQED